MADKEFTYAEVKEHSSKKDLYVVIHDKIYNASSFVDEHPGGEEVLLDTAGDDATEAFEDVGHSDEAREILDGLIIGKLKRMAGDPKPTVSGPTKPDLATARSESSGLGSLAMYAIVVLGGLAAFVGLKYVQGQQAGKA